MDWKMASSESVELQSGHESTSSGDDDSASSDDPCSPSKRSFSTLMTDSQRSAKKMRPSGFNDAQSSSGLNTQFSAQTMNMMSKMNYDTSKGLGKHGQGRVEIVPTSTQKGRRGLGLKLEGLETAASSWDEASESIQIPEKVVWLENTDESEAAMPDGDLLEKWLKRGTCKATLDGETKFCEPEILRKVLAAKTAFDDLGARDMRGARSRSNPFETIKSNIFMNRAAVKMANMDAMFNYMFTNPVDEAGNSLVRDGDLLYFADVCAGPGGFSEYFLWRKKWQAKGFGFTLRAKNDFKLNDFIAGTPETFDPFYGPKENGDIFDPENIKAFAEYVNKQTEMGVHVMMADGGFSVEGRENEQEILSKQLYLCQMLVALSIVRTGGNFVMKLFDLFTPFSVGLIYLMYKCFKKICICKPNTSRPANSERYLVCQWKNPGTDTIQHHLFDVNSFLFSKHDNVDVLELVPYSVLKEDQAFFQYISDSNNEIGKNQIVGLHKIAAFAGDPTLLDTRQAVIKSQCLTHWNLEDNMRKQKPKLTIDQYVNNLLGDWQKEKIFMSAADHPLNGCPKIDDVFPSIQGWHFAAIDTVENSGKNVRTFFLGRGGKEVMQYDMKTRSWIQLKEVHLELAPATLVYGEIVKELHGQGRSQTSINAFHIIDGISLGGVDIRKHPLQERIRMCEKFARALNKPCRSNTSQDSTGYSVSVPVRAKKLFTLSNIDGFFDRLEKYKLKDGTKRLGYNLRNTNEPDRFHVPRALLFLNEIRADYLKLFSRTHNKFYFYCKTRKVSFFPEQMDSLEHTIASFKNTFVNRVLWTWSNEQQLLDTGDEAAVIQKNPKLVYRDDLKRFLAEKNLVVK